MRLCGGDNQAVDRGTDGYSPRLQLTVELGGAQVDIDAGGLEEGEPAQQIEDAASPARVPQALGYLQGHHADGAQLVLAAQQPLHFACRMRRIVVEEVDPGRAVDQDPHSPRSW